MKPIGYILLHRTIFDHWTWRDKPFSKGQAWIDLIMMVNFAEGKDIVDGNTVIINRGETLTSYEKLSARWGWSRKKTTNFINSLKRDDMLLTKRAGRGTVLTIVNYDDFQDRGTDTEQEKEHKRNSSGTGKEHNIKNNNKYKRIKEKENTLSEEERIRRMKERQREEEAADFCRMRHLPLMTVDEYENYLSGNIPDKIKEYYEHL